MGKRSKAIKIPGGQKCKRCSRLMQRKEHPSHWRPRKNQPYYFRYWDQCKCGMFQLYEVAKVMIEQFEDPVEQEYREIMRG